MKLSLIYWAWLAVAACLAVSLSYFAAIFGHPVYLWFWRDLLGLIQ